MKERRVKGPRTWLWVFLLCKVLGEALTMRSYLVSHMSIWGKDILGRRNGECQGAASQIMCEMYEDNVYVE